MSADRKHELNSGIGLTMEPPLSPPVVDKSGVAHEPAPELDLQTLGVALRPPQEVSEPAEDASVIDELEAALEVLAPETEPEAELEPETAPPAELESDLPAMGPEAEPFDFEALRTTPKPETTSVELPLVGNARSAAQSFKVVVRLMDGNGVEVGEFKDFGTAMEGAQEVIEQFASANGSWPFYAGRFIRPDLIVSVDLVTEL
jgi:hypothetical protein